MSAGGESSGGHRATLLTTKLLVRDRQRNGESTGELSYDPTDLLAGTHV
jgi:hypothetical protein